VQRLVCFGYIIVSTACKSFVCYGVSEYPSARNCPVTFSSISEVSLWLSSSPLRELGYMHPFLSVPFHRKAEKPKFRLEYTLIVRLFSVFTLSFSFFSRYSVLVPSNLSAARMLLARRMMSSAYRITLTPRPLNSLSNLSRKVMVLCEVAMGFR